jgi:hypothetical protein
MSPVLVIAPTEIVASVDEVPQAGGRRLKLAIKATVVISKGLKCAIMNRACKNSEPGKMNMATSTFHSSISSTMGHNCKLLNSRASAQMSTSTVEGVLRLSGRCHTTEMI